VDRPHTRQGRTGRYQYGPKCLCSDRRLFSSNCCPKGFGTNKSDSENPGRIVKGPAGLEFAGDFAILPSLIEELWQERENAKQLKDTTLSQAVKILMNSFYGVLGTPGCRFYDPRLAVF